jgi:hypothetical protein
MDKVGKSLQTTWDEWSPYKCICRNKDFVQVGGLEGLEMDEKGTGKEGHFTCFIVPF